MQLLAVHTHSTFFPLLPVKSSHMVSLRKEASPLHCVCFPAGASNELCTFCGYQRYHPFLKADVHVAVWPLYSYAQKVSAILDTASQKRLESMAVRLSTNYCYVVILHDSCMCSGDEFFFEMWWCFGIITALTVVQGSPSELPKSTTAVVMSSISSRKQF